MPDRSDPAVRAVLRLQRTRRPEVSIRTTLCLGWAGLAVGAPIVTAALTGAGESAIGAAAFSVVCLALAIVLWPDAWSPPEHEHHELEAIWREVRTDADRQVPWDRYAAWAKSTGKGIELLLLHCGPAAQRTEGAPSPYDVRPGRRFEAVEVEAATASMEDLRAEAVRLEEEAQRRYEQRLEAAELAVERARLRRIDAEGAAQIRAGVERARQEVAAQEEAEDRAQADALARALRRP